jgi:DNA-binding response OmpR family regulator
MAEEHGRKSIILLIEGNRSEDSSLSIPLLNAGHEVHVFHTGRQAISWGQKQVPDLIIYDASSMRSNGARVCQRFRAFLENTPIIHCRAKGQSRDPAIAADVFLEHPLSSRRLLNRVHDQLPIDYFKEEVIRFGRLSLFRTKRAIDIGYGERRLTPKQAFLLEELLRHPNQLVTRRQIMLHVWQTEYIGDTRTLDVHVRWLRECIEEDPSKPKFLTTVRGKGFILSVPD